MDDLISRQAVKDWLLRWEGYIDKDTIIRMQARVIDIPSAEVQEVRHGQWITDNNKQTKCSICGRLIPLRKVRHNGEVIWEDNSPVNYCPRCGAKMDLECKDESN